MPDQLDLEQFTLSYAARSFIAATSTESGEHIKPLHRYLGVRLVVEGGFLPEELSPSPPLKSEYRRDAWYLSFDRSASDEKEQIVLGGLKSKRIDLVLAKNGIGPVLAISVKGTSKAFRNLVNRTEEAIGDCANIHIMYPGLVYGFVHFLRATDASDSTLKSNDILLDKKGQVITAVKDYSRILEGLSGRMLVRNDYSRYESVALALLKPSPRGGPSPLFTGFPGPSSPLLLDAFFQNLYRVYDLRFPYTYSDPGARLLSRIRWHRDSPLLKSMYKKESMKRSFEYEPRTDD